MVGLVLKVNPQLHCCYQNQSIKHTHRKILSKIFLIFRKKRKHAKAFTSKNGHITKKSPWLQCFIYDNICNTIIKSPGQIRSKPGVTVPRCTSHCFASIKKTVFEHASEHQRNETSQFCEYTASTQLRTSYKNRKPNGLVKKDSMRKKLSKNTSDRCCKTNKAGIQNQLFAEEEF